MTINSQPIAIFDSGLGGLTIAKQIRQQLPNENILYLADSHFAPYGDQADCAIRARVEQVADWLIKHKAKALVIACNTATVTTIENLRAELSLPIIGVEPAIKPAAKHSKTKHIGLLATQATANNSRFLQLVKAHANSCQVHIQPCPGLVELIEQDKAHSSECQALLKQYLTPLITHNIDQLVLGCTHYPVLTPMIRDYLGTQVSLVETAAPVTKQLTKQLAKLELTNQQNQLGWQQFYTTKVLNQTQLAASQQLMSKIFGRDLTLKTVCHTLG